MKRADVERFLCLRTEGDPAGTCVFAAKVSGRVVPVEVLELRTRESRRGILQHIYRVRNLETRRLLTMTAARLRWPLWPKGDRWTSCRPDVQQTGGAA